MRLLLDTHIWLWGVNQPKQLGARVTRALNAPRNELWLSPISVWEALTLIDSGRIRVRGSAADWVAEALDSVPMRTAPVTREIALATRVVVLTHNDPADRFLAATARTLDLTLVTADERLIAGKGYKVLANGSR